MGSRRHWAFVPAFQKKLVKTARVGAEMWHGRVWELGTDTSNIRRPAFGEFSLLH